MNEGTTWKPVLDSRQLLTFAALARRSSFTLAARDISLTQSAVSHAIKALEKEVGCRLVDRTGKRVLLTQAGEQFLRHTEKILQEMEIARSGLEAAAQRSHLRVGAGATAIQYILPGVLRELHQNQPELGVKIEPGDFGQQLELLRGNHIDFALTLEPSADGDVDFLPLFSDELQFIVAPGHSWTLAGKISREMIAEQTLVLYNKSSETFHLLSEYFREEKILLSNFIELGSVDAIKELVKAGYGAGVLAPWVVASELASGSLRALPLGNRKLRRRWGIAYLKGRRLAFGGEKFVRVCEKVVRALIPPAAAAGVALIYDVLVGAVELSAALGVG